MDQINLLLHHCQNEIRFFSTLLGLFVFDCDMQLSPYLLLASMCVSVAVIPDSPTASDMPQAAGSPLPGPSGLSALQPSSSSSGSTHPPSRLV